MTVLARRSDRTPDHRAFRDSVRRFIAGNVAADLDGWRRDGAVARSVFAEAGAHGFLGTYVPEDFGGGEAGDYTFLAALVEETVDAGSIGLALLWALHAGVVISQVLEHGTPEIHQQLLPPLVAGDTIAVAARVDDEHAVPGAQLADLVLMLGVDRVGVVAVTPPTTPALAGLAAPEAGCADLTIGSSAARSGIPLPVPPETVQRDVDLWIAVIAVAAARRSTELAIEYAQNRRVFGTPLSEFENTQMRLAEVAAELLSATTYVDHCLDARSNSALGCTEAAAAREISVRLARRAADQSLQLHGGYGYMREYPIARAFADIRFLSTTAQRFSDPRRVVAAGLFSGR
ncbi:acyl-CoA dehydrogenase family protein [Mycolicibacterium pulveris]|uniref:Acyl-CoA dehydrogenase n=1 Tax=Mycolicibacterium pulveris TaxID=36813 RepID=A0A7I7UG09_MYCPV|nr:acyl-CoA dehydrogenase family protein [Mycolicibacterium pulveris]MCV6981607.1 acyl-CoA dehydrogenase family protein [Mycolicibacterium pulveris]BBY80237.1 acyl-CoA dehydrogenase [Mycolicibacterium pulveris]